MRPSLVLFVIVSCAGACRRDRANEHPAGTTDAGTQAPAEGSIFMTQAAPTATPPSWETFFDSVERHLMTAPVRSEAIIAEALAGRLPRDPEGAWSALVAARSGSLIPWRDELAAPPSTPYVAFPLEQGLCDTIRARYHRGSHVIDIAESHYVYSVTLRGLAQDPSGPPLDIARAAARLLFRDDIGFSFVQSSSGAARPAFGRQDPDKPKYCPEWIHWLDHMKWWVRDAAVGFITFKGTCAPTPNFMRTDPHTDTHWFKH